MNYNYKFYATLLDAFQWYKVSESDNALQDFLNTINRVPVTDIDALDRMNKGKALNDLIDSRLNGIKQSECSYIFNDDLVNELTERLQTSYKQLYTSFTININGSNVLLYGYIDYLLYFKCIDLKTTKSYTLGKYKGNMQRHLYPVGLLDYGVFVDEFEFLVTDFTDIYTETYKVDIEESKQILFNECVELINFIESKRELITDIKIFGLE